MRIISGIQKPRRRSHVLLAPARTIVPGEFQGACFAPDRHHFLLSQTQRLRGHIAVREGAMRAEQLTPDGRDASPVDERAWHLLTLDDVGSVAGCVRMHMHAKNPRFSDLTISHTALAGCNERGPVLRAAVEAEIQHAQETGSAVVEVGGWVLADHLRRSSEAARLALGVWAWGQMLGGAVGFATATLRNHSACILGRIGGSALSHLGREIPKFYEPKYSTDIQILRFHSASYGEQYRGLVQMLSAEFANIPVLCARPAMAAGGSIGPVSYGRELARAASAA